MGKQELKDRLEELFSSMSPVELAQAKTAVPGNGDGVASTSAGSPLQAAAPGNGDGVSRWQTDVALEELRRQNLRILESAGEGIFGLDLDGKHTFVNPAAARMLGYKIEELVGRPSHATWHHTKADGTPYPQTECPIYAAYRDGRVHHGDDEVFWRKDGTSFPVEYTSTPIRQGDRLFGAVVTFRDIAERKQREEELQKTRQIQSLLNALMRISLEDILLEVLLERALDVIVAHAPFLSLDTSVGIFLVEGEANVLALKASRGLPAALLNVCARVPFGRCLCGRAAASGEIQFADCVDDRHEHRYEGMRPHGHYTVPIWSKGKVAGVIVVYLREGHVSTQQDHDFLSAMAATLASMIERKRAEEELLRFKLGIERSTDAVFITDVNGTILYTNPAFEKVYGHSREEAVGKTPRILKSGIVPLENYQQFWGALLARSTVSGEIVNKTKDGRLINIEGSNSAIVDWAGNVIGFLGVHRDVTARKQAEAERGQLLADVQSRAADLATVAKVGNAATTIHNTQELLQTVADLTQENFDLYHAHIYLLNASGNTLDLAAGAGEVGRRMVEQEHRISLDSEKSLVAKAARTRQSVLVDDVRQAPDFLPNALLPDTRSEMAVPLIFGNEVLGVLDVQSDRPSGFSDEDSSVQTVLAAQVATALHNAQLHEQTQAALNELGALQRLMTREGWQVYRAAHQQTRRGFRYDQVQVRPADETQIQAPAGDAFSAVSTLQIRGESIGFLGLECDPDRPLPPQDRELLESLTTQVSQALERARLLDQTQKRAIEIETVAQVSTVASTLLDPERLLETVVQLTQRRFGLYHCHVYMLDPAGDVMRIAACGWREDDSRGSAHGDQTIRLDQEHSLVARAARTRRPVVANEVRSDPHWQPDPVLPETRAEMALPLRVGDRLLGVFDMHAARSNAFAEEDARIYGTLAAQVAVALQNAHLYAEQTATVTRLRELDQLKSSFLANMSHELRTPLNSILGFTDVMLEGLDGPLSESMESDLGLISKNGRHLLSLINDVLDMAKIEAGKMNLVIESVNLPTVLDEVIDIISPLAREKSLYLTLESEQGADLHLEADEIRLRQIMLNLVSNAVKFTETGGVAVQTRRKGEWIHVDIRDTGVGISPDEHHIIFEEFRQADTSTTRRAGGTGLGLPISKRLTEMHGGTLTVQSSGVPGEGATFRVAIPVKSSDRPAPLPDKQAVAA